MRRVETLVSDTLEVKQLLTVHGIINEVHEVLLGNFSGDSLLVISKYTLLLSCTKLDTAHPMQVLVYLEQQI